MGTTKAFLMTETKKKIPLQFNPDEISFSKGNTWNDAASAGSNAPSLEFSSGGSVEFTITATFDSTDSGKPVTSVTDQLYELTLTDPSIKGTKEDRNMARPPWVQFHWGSLRSFKAVVTDFGLTFTYFASDGTPLRAEVSLTLRQFEDEGRLPPQNPTSGTPAPHRLWTVGSGEFLDTIADQVYGSPGGWRRIAAANGIDDPLDLSPGRILVIPQLED